MSEARSFEEIHNGAARSTHEWMDLPDDECQWGRQFVRDLLRVYGLTETRAAFYEMREAQLHRQAGLYRRAGPGKLAVEMKPDGRDFGAHNVQLRNEEPPP